jgi:hypothetical protein
VQPPQLVAKRQQQLLFVRKQQRRAPRPPALLQVAGHLGALQVIAPRELMIGYGNALHALGLGNEPVLARAFFSHHADHRARRRLRLQTSEQEGHQR